MRLRWHRIWNAERVWELRLDGEPVARIRWGEASGRYHYTPVPSEWAGLPVPHVRDGYPTPQVAREQLFHTFKTRIAMDAAWALALVP